MATPKIEQKLEPKTDPKPDPKPDAKKLAPALVHVAVDKIVPDAHNRAIGDDEDFQSLADSIRVLGVLQPLHVREADAGLYELADGERRWRAAKAVEATTVPCLVWPAGTPNRDMVVAGVALNEHRKAHGCLQVARRLRQIKNQCAETLDQIAARTGIPLMRVRLYLGLFDASDHLLAFFETDATILTVAAEFVRFERAAGEAEARRLVQRHREQPLSVRDLARLRKDRTKDEGDDPASSRRPNTSPRRSGANLAGRIAAAFDRDAVGALEEVRAALEKLGFELVSAAPTAGTRL